MYYKTKKKKKKKKINALKHTSQQCTHLIESWEDVVSKLNLCNGSCSCGSYTYSKSYNALLTQWSIEHTVFSW